MQGVIAKCLEELVHDEYGREKWEQILEQAGLHRDTTFAGRADVPDDTVVLVVRTACEVLDLSPVQIADSFKDYWVRVFAPKLYETYYHAAKESFVKNDPMVMNPDDKPLVMH